MFYNCMLSAIQQRFEMTEADAFPRLSVFTNAQMPFLKRQK